MADPAHVTMLWKGVDVWNQWRLDNPEVLVNLNGAILPDGDFQGFDLSGVMLMDAIVSRANFSRAKFRMSNLKRANFTLAKLCEADLSWADLTEAILIGTDFRGATLSEAALALTVFGDTNLSEVRGLESCRHLGPSIIDNRTLARSGRLPAEFLRNGGVPTAIIEGLTSLLNQSVEFYSCFISYSTKDQEFADRLYADLLENGVRCWFAPHDIKGGRKIHEQIDEAIRVYDRLLLILSPQSMNSEWVKTEIAKARKREVKEARRVLFPIRLVDYETLRDWECFDADTGKDSAREIREYFIPDFSNWKDGGSYRKAKDELLRDLRANVGP